MQHRYNYRPEPIGYQHKSIESNWFNKIIMDMTHDIHIEFRCRGMYDGSYFCVERCKPDYDFWYTVYYDGPKKITKGNYLLNIISWFYDKFYKSRIVYKWIQPNEQDVLANKPLVAQELLSKVELSQKNNR